jgi:polyisoprenyl-phosphate glycosyltransferase
MTLLKLAAREGFARLSVVLPCHNEQEVLPATHERLTLACDALHEEQFEYELIFVNDGSRDGTGEILDELAQKDSRVRVAHLTRNFGHQAAVTAGLQLAAGDVIVIMDADLQDPPEVLIAFLEKWRQGYDVIYAIRSKRKEWFGKRLAYWAFYRLLAAISDIQMPLDSGDFCTMDRRAVDLLNSLPERQRFVRGLRTWIGLRQIGIRYEREARFAGRPSYTFSSLMRLASDGLVSFSVKPLRLATRLGMLGVVAAVLLAVWVIGTIVLSIEAPRGWASLACLVLFMSSVQLVTLGIMGEYLARVFLEVKDRPTFLLDRVTGAGLAAAGEGINGGGSGGVAAAPVHRGNKS